MSSRLYSLVDRIGVSCLTVRTPKQEHVQFFGSDGRGIHIDKRQNKYVESIFTVQYHSMSKHLMFPRRHTTLVYSLQMLLIVCMIIIKMHRRMTHRLMMRYATSTHCRGPPWTRQEHSKYASSVLLLPFIEYLDLADRAGHRLHLKPGWEVLCWHILTPVPC